MTFHHIFSQIQQLFSFEPELGTSASSEQVFPVDIPCPALKNQNKFLSENCSRKFLHIPKEIFVKRKSLICTHRDKSICVFIYALTFGYDHFYILFLFAF